MEFTVSQIARMIDHSILQPQFTSEDVREGCAVAAKYHVASVCVRPSDVPLAVELLHGTDVQVGTVIGFPHGATSTEVKVVETEQAVARGATEIDMVINIGWLRSGDIAAVENEIRAIVQAAGEAPVKVILETAYLTDEEKLAACWAAERAGAAFVKTSTGFAPKGATIDDLALMRSAVSPKVQVKASGGIRSLDTLLAMAAVGVTRFGSSATADILEDLARRQASAPTGRD
ncbi:deoxyribose-phosphate aldolase [Actinoplanes teichomyceticus]|uniref:Deoxyribose-phosphate aldolase n=1 Tax=Actinoplanes teichomyceticus TaxID=1867 RepID=A0A561VQZ3_ACTTI|nr:deoxyribose-phosphate aldolase [Actinoplanes teichomyceticus]TWG14035.1 deoxyribose-phosphate aldolase [Actinoplanes teichomyceticus]GIF16769.1 deoxyribose-phosphate aldolase [Actinoplanes teichomyceticus]